MDVLRICQGFPCFGPWLLLGIVYFEVLGDVWGSGGVNDEGGACFVSNYGGVGVD